MTSNTLSFLLRIAKGEKKHMNSYEKCRAFAGTQSTHTEIAFRGGRRGSCSLALLVVFFLFHEGFVHKES